MGSTDEIELDKFVPDADGARLVKGYRHLTVLPDNCPWCQAPLAYELRKFIPEETLCWRVYGCATTLRNGDEPDYVHRTRGECQPPKKIQKAP